MSVSQISRRGWIVLIGVPALFVLAYILALKPALTGLPLCGVKMFTGIDCPGCGLTRSIAYLTHGQIRRSIDYHPLGIVIALWLVYMLIGTALGFILGRPMPRLVSQKTADLLLIVFVAALFGQWLVKLFFSFHF